MEATAKPKLEEEGVIESSKPGDSPKVENKDKLEKVSIKPVDPVEDFFKSAFHGFRSAGTAIYTFLLASAGKASWQETTVSISSSTS